MSNNLDKVIVVKIGGATLNSGDTIIEDIVYLQKQGRRLVVVHGGAKEINDWLSRLGISTRFVEGERVTDKATLEVVTAVLAGLVNKEIVAAINNLGGYAVGLSGVDGALIQGRIKDREMGYTGTVAKLEVNLLRVLLESGYIPVISPVSLYSFDRPRQAPQILNINGDPVAGEIAAAIGAEKLVFLSDVVGICNGQGRPLKRLSPAEAEALITSGAVSGGMIPKVRACLKALATTSTTHIIDGREPHALLKEVETDGSGTTIEAVR